MYPPRECLRIAKGFLHAFIVISISNIRDRIKYGPGTVIRDD